MLKMFILGRPGSGKTTAMHRICQVYRQWGGDTLRVRDYEILYEMFRNDQRVQGGRFQQTSYGGFDVLDMSVVNEALIILEKSIHSLLTAENTHESQRALPLLVTIEFARDDYEQALKNFSLDFLRDAYFFFVEADLETCIKRIHQRIIFPSDQERPLDDCHYVSDYIMQTYYNQDCQDYVEKRLRQDFHLEKAIKIYRNKDTLRELYSYVDTFMQTELAVDIGLQATNTMLV